MSYQVFARKYRPQTFSELLGQEHIVKTLMNAIDNDRIAQAYLFVGPRGTGKTSIARILAKALNCSNGPSTNFSPEEPLCQEINEGRSLDVLEVDGASNNSVDQIRNLCSNVQFMPSQGRFKIYYIDEVHMLTTQAFNALLKTLEEPPAHIKFIFATTEPHKILPTIISRCQRFDLKPISEEIIASHLMTICKKEKIKLSEEASSAIAKGARGGMRDSQSMLDQLVAFCGKKIEEEDVLQMFGFPSMKAIEILATSILKKEILPGITLLSEQEKEGKDLSYIMVDLIHFFREILTQRIAKTSFISKEIQSLQEEYEIQQLTHILTILSEGEKEIKASLHKRLFFEISLIKATESLREITLNQLLFSLEKKGAKIIEPSSISTPERKVSSSLKVSSSSIPDDKKSSLEISETENTQEEEGFFIWKSILNKIEKSPSFEILAGKISSKEIALHPLSIQINIPASERILFQQIQEYLPKLERALKSLKGEEWEIQIISFRNAQENPEEDLIKKALQIFEASIE